MTVNEIMQYIESEFNIINSTPCEVCGGDFITDDSLVALIDNMPFDICQCICSSCGHKKRFFFTAPFIPAMDSDELKNRLN